MLNGEFIVKRYYIDNKIGKISQLIFSFEQSIAQILQEPLVHHEVHMEILQCL